MESTYNNNNSEMKDQFDNCADDKVCLYETVISGGFINEELYNTDNKQRSVHDNITIKDENIDDQKVVDFINENPSDMQYKQGSIHNYITIKNENIDALITNCTDDMVCLNETAITGGYIKQEPCGMKDEQGNIQNYLGIKDENLDDLTVIAQETELVTDFRDSKVCIYETIISGGHIKEEPCDTGYESGSIHSNVDMKGCSECGEKYDLYCLKCSMLIRVFDSNDPDSTDAVMQTLPKNFINICKTQFGIGTVALRAIPKGVVFGPFKGLDSTKAETISKWKLKNKKLDITKDAEGLNWMRYIRRTDKSCHQNLVPFQYEDELYYRSECHLNVGDELLVHWDSDSKESKINDMEDSYLEPPVYESLDDSYACTLCCVGYKSINHLKSHNTTCIEKRNRKDFCEEIVQCDICKIYLDKKEYSDCHMDRCSKSNEKCVFSFRPRRNPGHTLPYRIQNGDKHIAVNNDDRPFACTLCPYKATTKSNLKQHISIHNGDKSFACTLCPYKTTRKSNLRLHMSFHNDDKPFACTLCPYKATTKSNLKQHVSIHNGEKPFACSLCPHKTTRKSYLKLHIALHNDNKPFACALCPYKARTKAILKRHNAVHNNDKPFACTLCTHKTTRKSYLKLHIAVHNDDRPFACTLCPYKARRKTRLKQHIASHNGNKI